MPEDQELADDLRSIDFALNRARVALVAFVDKRYIEAVGRDFDRCGEAQEIIARRLKDLPDALPLTPEQEANAQRWIKAALDRRFGPPDVEVE